MTVAAEDDWRQRAACRGGDVDPDWFFYDTSAGRGLAAIKVCRRCPVRAACGRWAVETGQQVGVWGGMTEYELRSAIRTYRAATS